MRLVRPTSACASALGPATALSGTTGHTGTAGPIECTGVDAKHAASGVASRLRHDRSDASLKVLVPFSARLPRRALPGAATRTGDPASTVDRLSHATSFALMPRGIMSPTQWRRPVCPCGFALTKLARSTLRGSTPRVLIETLRRCRDASLHRARRPPRVMRRRLSAAGVPLPAIRFTWPGRAPFGVAKLHGFPSRERGRHEAGRLSRV